jgi:heme A synthase
MLYLWALIGAVVAVVAFAFSVWAFVVGKLLLGFALFVLAALAAVVAVTAYYARERVNSVREFFGWA